MSWVIQLDADQCYRVAQSRDSRFDGWFYIAVRTTGIYCRPSCPAITPKRANVEFFPSAAAAQQHGFRACKRCRPDASPGSPEWNMRGDVVARAMRLIADGIVDREGVAGLAARLGYSSRHLTRLVTDELGAGPLALARAQRAQTARVLIETSSMSMTDVAFAAGFGSVRQFNDTVREVYALAPGELRRRSSFADSPAEPGAVVVRLPTRGPFAGREAFEFLGMRAIPGVELFDGERYHRTLALPHGHGIAVLEPRDSHVRAELSLADWRDLAPAVERLRRLLDLDADPIAVDAVLGDDRVLEPLVAKTPGRRAPGAVDPFEIAVRGVVGQQVSVAGARTVTARIVEAAGDVLTVAHDRLTHVFPSPTRLAALDPTTLPMPRARGRTLIGLAGAVADGSIALDTGADREDLVQQLVALPGIGQWTARYTIMRGLGDPDVFLDTDLGVRHALDRLGIVATDAERWRPWRTYALHHLWATL
jgi:AraC family transcriptional regulator of adaptative response / DNA-3-methyladenine glycosylase II